MGEINYNLTPAERGALRGALAKYLRARGLDLAAQDLDNPNTLQERMNALGATLRGLCGAFSGLSGLEGGAMNVTDVAVGSGALVISLTRDGRTAGQSEAFLNVFGQVLFPMLTGEELRALSLMLETEILARCRSPYGSRGEVALH